MGTFGGHALPGSFFIVFGLWWMVQILRRYYRSLGKDRARYQSSLTFHCGCLCGRLARYEVEGIIMIVFTLVGGALEIYTGFHEGKFAYLGNGQHATMFFFFGLVGVVRLLLHHHVALPRGLDYVAMAMALAVEGLLFMLHKSLHSELEFVLHRLLVYVVLAEIISVLLELLYRGSVLPAIARAYCTLLQGTWFWQVAFILYNPIPGAPVWEQDNPKNITLATMFFAWHMAAAFIITLLLAALIGSVARCRGNFHVTEYDSLSMNLIASNNNSQTIINVHESGESDLEYEKPVSRER